MAKAPFVVRRSCPGKGKGLFAARPFARHEFIVEYTGKRLPNAYADTLGTRYLFEVDEKWTVDGSSSNNIARYINHSCAPNAEADIHDGRVLIAACRPIRKGEEITMDYGEEYFDEFIKPAGCRCGECTARVL